MAKLNSKKILELRLNSCDSEGEIILTNDLAKALNLSYKVVSRMETDDTYNPGVLTLNRLSTHYGVSIDSLIIKD
jgi:transcriptional regulator with XRE-family HTH domain